MSKLFKLNIKHKIRNVKINLLYGAIPAILDMDGGENSDHLLDGKLLFDRKS